MMALSYFCPEIVNVPDLIEGAASVGGNDVVGSVLVDVIVKPDRGVDLLSRQVKVGRSMESPWKKPSQGVQH